MLGLLSIKAKEKPVQNSKRCLVFKLNKNLDQSKRLEFEQEIRKNSWAYFKDNVQTICEVFQDNIYDLRVSYDSHPVIKRQKIKEKEIPAIVSFVKSFVTTNDSQQVPVARQTPSNFQYLVLRNSKWQYFFEPKQSTTENAQKCEPRQRKLLFQRQNTQPKKNYDDQRNAQTTVRNLQHAYSLIPQKQKNYKDSLSGSKTSKNHLSTFHNEASPAKKAYPLLKNLPYEIDSDSCRRTFQKTIRTQIQGKHKPVNQDHSNLHFVSEPKAKDSFGFGKISTGDQTSFQYPHRPKSIIKNNTVHQESTSRQQTGHKSREKEALIKTMDEDKVIRKPTSQNKSRHANQNQGYSVNPSNPLLADVKKNQLIRFKERPLTNENKEDIKYNSTRLVNELNSENIEQRQLAPLKISNSTQKKINKEPITDGKNGQKELNSFSRNPQILKTSITQRPYQPLKTNLQQKQSSDVVPDAKDSLGVKSTELKYKRRQIQSRDSRKQMTPASKSRQAHLNSRNNNRLKDFQSKDKNSEAKSTTHNRQNIVPCLRPVKSRESYQNIERCEKTAPLKEKRQRRIPVEKEKTQRSNGRSENLHDSPSKRPKTQSHQKASKSKQIVPIQNQKPNTLNKSNFSKDPNHQEIKNIRKNNTPAPLNLKSDSKQKGNNTQRLNIPHQKSSIISQNKGQIKVKLNDDKAVSRSGKDENHNSQDPQQDLLGKQYGENKTSSKSLINTKKLSSKKIMEINKPPNEQNNQKNEDINEKAESIEEQEIEKVDNFERMPSNNVPSLKVCEKSDLLLGEIPISDTNVSNIIKDKQQNDNTNQSETAKISFKQHEEIKQPAGRLDSTPSQKRLSSKNLMLKEQQGNQCIGYSQQKLNVSQKMNKNQGQCQYPEIKQESLLIKQSNLQTLSEFPKCDENRSSNSIINRTDNKISELESKKTLSDIVKNENQSQTTVNNANSSRQNKQKVSLDNNRVESQRHIIAKQQLLKQIGMEKVQEQSKNQQSLNNTWQNDNQIKQTKKQLKRSLLQTQSVQTNKFKESQEKKHSAKSIKINQNSQTESKLQFKETIISKYQINPVSQQQQQKIIKKEDNTQEALPCQTNKPQPGLIHKVNGPKSGNIKSKQNVQDKNLFQQDKNESICNSNREPQNIHKAQQQIVSAENSIGLENPAEKAQQMKEKSQMVNQSQNKTIQKREQLSSISILNHEEDSLNTGRKQQYTSNKQVLSNNSQVKLQSMHLQEQLSSEKIIIKDNTVEKPLQHEEQLKTELIKPSLNTIQSEVKPVQTQSDTILTPNQRVASQNRCSQKIMQNNNDLNNQSKSKESIESEQILLQNQSSEQHANFDQLISNENKMEKKEEILKNSQSQLMNNKQLSQEDKKAECEIKFSDEKRCLKSNKKQQNKENQTKDQSKDNKHLNRVDNLPQKTGEKIDFLAKINNQQNTQKMNIDAENDLQPKTEKIGRSQNNMNKQIRQNSKAQILQIDDQNSSQRQQQNLIMESKSDENKENSNPSLEKSANLQANNQNKKRSNPRFTQNSLGPTFQIDDQKTENPVKTLSTSKVNENLSEWLKNEEDQFESKIEVVADKNTSTNKNLYTLEEKPIQNPDEENNQDDEDQDEEMEEVDFLDDPDEHEEPGDPTGSLHTYEPSQPDIQSTTSIMMKRRQSYGIGMASKKKIKRKLTESNEYFNECVNEEKEQEDEQASYISPWDNYQNELVSKYAENNMGSSVDWANLQSKGEFPQQSNEEKDEPQVSKNEARSSKLKNGSMRRKSQYSYLKGKSSLSHESSEVLREFQSKVENPRNQDKQIERSQQIKPKQGVLPSSLPRIKNGIGNNNLCEGPKTSLSNKEGTRRSKQTKKLSKRMSIDEQVLIKKDQESQKQILAQQSKLKKSGSIVSKQENVRNQLLKQNNFPVSISRQKQYQQKGENSRLNNENTAKGGEEKISILPVQVQEKNESLAVQRVRSADQAQPERQLQQNKLMNQNKENQVSPLQSFENNLIQLQDSSTQKSQSPIKVKNENSSRESQSINKKMQKIIQSQIKEPSKSSLQIVQSSSKAQFQTEFLPIEPTDKNMNENFLIQVSKDQKQLRNMDQQKDSLVKISKPLVKQTSHHSLHSQIQRKQSNENMSHTQKDLIMQCRQPLKSSVKVIQPEVLGQDTALLSKNQPLNNQVHKYLQSDVNQIELSKGQTFPSLMKNEPQSSKVQLSQKILVTDVMETQKSSIEAVQTAAQVQKEILPQPCNQISHKFEMPHKNLEPSAAEPQVPKSQIAETPALANTHNLYPSTQFQNKTQKESLPKIQEASVSSAKIHQASEASNKSQPLIEESQRPQPFTENPIPSSSQSNEINLQNSSLIRSQVREALKIPANPVQDQMNQNEQKLLRQKSNPLIQNESCEVNQSSQKGEPSNKSANQFNEKPSLVDKIDQPQQNSQSNTSPYQPSVLSQDLVETKKTQLNDCISSEKNQQLKLPQYQLVNQVKRASNIQIQEPTSCKMENNEEKSNRTRGIISNQDNILTPKQNNRNQVEDKQLSQRLISDSKKASTGNSPEQLAQLQKQLISSSILKETEVHSARKIISEKLNQGKPNSENEQNLSLNNQKQKVQQDQKRLHETQKQKQYSPQANLNEVKKQDRSSKSQQQIIGNKQNQEVSNQIPDQNKQKAKERIIEKNQVKLANPNNMIQKDFNEKVQAVEIKNENDIENIAGQRFSDKDILINSVKQTKKQQSGSPVSRHSDKSKFLDKESQLYPNRVVEIKKTKQSNQSSKQNIEDNKLLQEHRNKSNSNGERQENKNHEDRMNEHDKKDQQPQTHSDYQQPSLTVHSNRKASKQIKLQGSTQKKNQELIEDNQLSACQKNGCEVISNQMSSMTQHQEKNKQLTAQTQKQTLPPKLQSPLQSPCAADSTKKSSKLGIEAENTLKQNYDNGNQLKISQIKANQQASEEKNLQQQSNENFQSQKVSQTPQEEYNQPKVQNQIQDISKDNQHKSKNSKQYTTSRKRISQQNNFTGQNNAKKEKQQSMKHVQLKSVTKFDHSPELNQNTSKKQITFNKQQQQSHKNLEIKLLSLARIQDIKLAKLPLDTFDRFHSRSPKLQDANVRNSSKQMLSIDKIEQKMADEYQVPNQNQREKSTSKRKNTLQSEKVLKDQNKTKNKHQKLVKKNPQNKKLMEINKYNKNEVKVQKQTSQKKQITSKQGESNQKRKKSPKKIKQQRSQRTFQHKQSTSEAQATNSVHQTEQSQSSLEQNAEEKEFVKDQQDSQSKDFPETKKTRLLSKKENRESNRKIRNKITQQDAELVLNSKQKKENSKKAKGQFLLKQNNLQPTQMFSGKKKKTNTRNKPSMHEQQDQSRNLNRIQKPVRQANRQVDENQEKSNTSSEYLQQKDPQERIFQDRSATNLFRQSKLFNKEKKSIRLSGHQNQQNRKVGSSLREPVNLKHNDRKQNPNLKAAQVNESTQITENTLLSSRLQSKLNTNRYQSLRNVQPNRKQKPIQEVSCEEISNDHQSNKPPPNNKQPIVIIINSGMGYLPQNQLSQLPENIEKIARQHMPQMISSPQHQKIDGHVAVKYSNQQPERKISRKIQQIKPAIEEAVSCQSRILQNLDLSEIVDKTRQQPDKVLDKDLDKVVSKPEQVENSQIIYRYNFEKKPRKTSPSPPWIDTPDKYRQGISEISHIYARQSNHSRFSPQRSPFSPQRQQFSPQRTQQRPPPSRSDFVRAGAQSVHTEPNSEQMNNTMNSVGWPPGTAATQSRFKPNFGPSEAEIVSQILSKKTIDKKNYAKLNNCFKQGYISIPVTQTKFQKALLYGIRPQNLNSTNPNPSFSFALNLLNSLSSRFIGSLFRNYPQITDQVTTFIWNGTWKAVTTDRSVPISKKDRDVSGSLPGLFLQKALYLHNIQQKICVGQGVDDYFQSLTGCPMLKFGIDDVPLQKLWKMLEQLIKQKERSQKSGVELKQILVASPIASQEMPFEVIGLEKYGDGKFIKLNNTQDNQLMEFQRFSQKFKVVSILYFSPNFFYNAIPLANAELSIISFQLTAPEKSIIYLWINNDVQIIPYKLCLYLEFEHRKFKFIGDKVFKKPGKLFSTALKGKYLIILERKLPRKMLNNEVFCCCTTDKIDIKVNLSKFSKTDGGGYENEGTILVPVQQTKNP